MSIVGLVAVLVALLLFPLSLLSSSAAVYTFSMILLIVALLVFIAALITSIVFVIKGRISDVKSGRKKKFNLCFKILCALGCIVDFVLIGLITDWSFRTEEAFLIIIALILPGILTQCLYFTPYLIANSKNHPQETAIFVLNLFAGWTIIAWIIALVWACTSAKEKVVIQRATQISKADELGKYKTLLDSGVITQEEFDAQKKQLLGL